MLITPLVTATVTGVTPLPVELLRLICDAADPSDLYSIALSSKSLNEIATPTLYSAIDLQVFHAIYACIRTLASSPTKTVMHRDLAGFVETISLRDPDSWAETSTWKFEHHGVMERRLATAVPRMRRLRSFSCPLVSLTAQTFTTLASGILPYVHTLDIEVSFWGPRSATHAEDDAVAAPAPEPIAVRSLKSLKLHWCNELPEPYRAFVHSILAASRHTLHTLSLPSGAADALKSAWESIPSFPALRELDAPPELLSEPAFQDTSSIRHFVVPDWGDYVELDPTALPNLEAVTCCPDQLEAFLPEHATHRRPIKIVTLNHARYERSRLGGYYIMEDCDIAPYWGNRILGAIRFSGAHLVRLSVAIAELSVSAMSAFLPFMKELEYLMIMLQFTPGEEGDGDEISDVAPLLKGMPRLHTFLLSDCVKKTRDDEPEGPFEFAYDEDYQRAALAACDETSSSLRRVAFTSEFEWEKRHDGWHPWGHVVADREIVSDGEDEDEDETAEQGGL